METRPETKTLELPTPRADPKAYASRSCKSCYGTGVVGRVVTEMKEIPGTLNSATGRPRAVRAPVRRVLPRRQEALNAASKKPIFDRDGAPPSEKHVCGCAASRYARLTNLLRAYAAETAKVPEVATEPVPA